MTTNIVKLFKSAEETETPEEVAVQGTLPEWLHGTYYRVGPGKFDLNGGFTMNHMLDGYAILTKFDINPDRVTFEKKFLQSDSYRRAMAAGKPVLTEFGTGAYSDPNKSLFSKFVSALIPEFTDNDYSTLFRLGGDLYSICDTCFFRQIHRERLGESQEKHDSNKLFGLNGQSAHPLRDDNGDLWNIGFTFFPSLKYQVVKVPHLDGGKSGKEMLKGAKTIATIPSRWNGALATLHSFGMSRDHIIFIEQPMVVSVSKLFTALVKKTSVREWLEWKAEDKNRFVVLSKAGKVSKVEFYSRDSFYFMHVINAFEEEEQIVLDLITYASASVLDIFYLENLRENYIKPSDFPRFQRFVIPLVEDIKKIPEMENLVRGSHHKAQAMREGSRIILDPENMVEEEGLEFPSINPSFGRKLHRFTYATGTINHNWFRHKVAKVDSETKRVWAFKENDFTFPGEPLFIPDPKGEAEDDGLVMAAMTDAREDGPGDFLVFLNNEMKEVARATFTQNFPLGLHGIFMQH